MKETTAGSKWGFHADGTMPSPHDRRWILVFGSNLAGRHGAGAALAAARNFGAEYGVGAGLTGSAYALPTKGLKLEVLSLEQIEASVQAFMQVARSMEDSSFWVTRVGCGLAGYKDMQIAPMFRAAPANCNFAQEWRSILLGPTRTPEP